MVKGGLLEETPKETINRIEPKGVLRGFIPFFILNQGFTGFCKLLLRQRSIFMNKRLKPF